MLRENGIAAIGYHADMDNADERKPGMLDGGRGQRAGRAPLPSASASTKARFAPVVHLSLQKSIEQFYQEAGRAGAMANLPIVSCCGRRKTPACWRISSNNSPMQRRKGARGTATTKFAGLQNRRNAVTRSSVITSGKRRHGRIAVPVIRAFRPLIGTRFEKQSRPRSTAGTAKRKASATAESRRNDSVASRSAKKNGGL